MKRSVYLGHIEIPACFFICGVPQPVHVMIPSNCDVLRGQRFNSFLLHLQLSCTIKHGDPMFSLKKIMVLNICF